MKFDIKDLPYSQFEQLGMSKKDVITMNPQELANLLNGGRTGLLTLTIPVGQGIRPIQADAKLSLIRNPDNTLSLGVHPILEKPKNTIDASPEQWIKILNGEPIIKEAKTYNGSMEPHIFQLDKQTNEILSARLNTIQLPVTFKGTPLTPDQTEQLKKGLTVQLENRITKESTIVQLDLNEAKGYKLSSKELSREQAPKEAENVNRGIKM